MRPSELVAGRYRLDDRIASGGQGEVWRGFDTRLERSVAIKLLHSGLSGNERFRTRFHQEAKAVAALQAPGIVGLYDYGEEQTSDGIASYLVMELVDGPSLAKLVHDRGRMSPRQAMTIVAETADALQSAHRVGLVHRDIKPANILLTGEGHPKIVDFGIARAKGEAGLTETGMVMGTVAYASPEQLCDNNLTGASDIYSLGIVAYECLSGRQPFATDSPAAAIQAQLNQPPPPLPNDIPQPVADVIAKALAKDPRERWTSAAEFAQACRDAASGGGTTMLLAAAADQARTQVMPRNTAPTARVAPPRRPEPPMPPPRDPEPEKSSKALPILVTLAVVAVLAAVLVLVFAFNGSGDDGAADDPSSSEKKTTEQEKTTADEETTSEETTQEQTTSEETTQEQTTEEDPGTATVPDVVGDPLATALSKIDAAGFDTKGWNPDNESEGTKCEVTEQSPGPNEQVSTDTQVDVTYIGPADECDPGPAG